MFPANDYVQSNASLWRAKRLLHTISAIDFFFSQEFPHDREPLRVKGNRVRFGGPVALAQGRARPTFVMKSPGVPFTP